MVLIGEHGIDDSNWPFAINKGEKGLIASTKLYFFIQESQRLCFKHYKEQSHYSNACFEPCVWLGLCSKAGTM